jgi:hypothetical protein
MKFTDPEVLQAIRYGKNKGPLLPLVAGNFELGVDMRNKPWPGELFITAGPDPKVLIADEVLIHLSEHPEQIHPDVTLERHRCTDLHPCTCPPAARVGRADCPQHGFNPKICLICHCGAECFARSLLRFVTRQGTVVYTITGHQAAPPAWVAEWPD